MLWIACRTCSKARVHMSAQSCEPSSILQILVWAFYFLKSTILPTLGRDKRIPEPQPTDPRATIILNSRDISFHPPILYQRARRHVAVLWRVRMWTYAGQLHGSRHFNSAALTCCFYNWERKNGFKQLLPLLYLYRERYNPIFKNMPTQRMVWLCVTALIGWSTRCPQCVVDRPPSRDMTSQNNVSFLGGPARTLNY